jgi:hypothetical protein
MAKDFIVMDYRNIEITAKKGGNNRVFIKKGDVVDFDNCVVDGEDGYSYKRVLVPDSHFLFERI